MNCPIVIDGSFYFIKLMEDSNNWYQTIKIKLYRKKTISIINYFFHWTK